MIRVLFVCLGNICRSPSADAVLRHQVAEAGLSAQIQVDSAGTSNWHQGEAPDARAIAAGQRRGYDLSLLRARQVQPEDFDLFDYVLAMDSQNLTDLQHLCPHSARTQPQLFLREYGHSQTTEVPDPYYGGPQGFNQVLDLLEPACQALLAEIRQKLSV